MRPRVLQLLATGSTGGAQESYTGLLLRLDRSVYDVRALSLSRGSAVQRLERLGVKVEVIDETDDAAATTALATYLTRNEIDLVHAHMFRAEVVGTRAAIDAGTPVVMATVHSSRVRSPEDVATLAALTPFMDRLLIPSDSIADKVEREGRHAPHTIIPNGVDLSRFALPATPCTLRDELGIPCEHVLLGVVARLEAEKGHRYLVEAMPAILERAPDTWLVIVGEGSLCSSLKAQVAALPAPARDRIVFTGRRDDISSITADMDIAVLPSLREAQGISILEAMARRKPVVASCVGGIPEVVTQGVVRVSWFRRPLRKRWPMPSPPWPVPRTCGSGWGTPGMPPSRSGSASTPWFGGSRASTPRSSSGPASPRSSPPRGTGTMPLPVRTPRGVPRIGAPWRSRPSSPCPAAPGSLPSHLAVCTT